MNSFDYSDLTVLDIDTGLENELCKIMYSHHYRKLLGYFRALISKRELSKRALALTGELITASPALYTAWNYRFDIVKNLFQGNDNNLNTELDWLDDFTLNNPKNYQIWSYRQALLKLYEQPKIQREYPITEIMIDDDTKNYHVWSYRKWVVLFFQDFSHEWKFTDVFIERDIYNNSAWTHRMFILKNIGTMERIQEEIKYTTEKIKISPHNISPWNHLRGIYGQFLEDKYDTKIIDFALTFVNGFFDKDCTIDSSYALEFLAYVYSKSPATHLKSQKAYIALGEKYDPIRVNLWQLKINKLMSNHP